MIKCKICDELSDNIIHDMCVDCLGDMWGDIIEISPMVGPMITSTPLRSIGRDQAKREIMLCLDDDPGMSVAELAERLIIDFDLIEEIVGELRK